MLRQDEVETGLDSALELRVVVYDEAYRARVVESDDVVFGTGLGFGPTSDGKSAFDTQQEERAASVWHCIPFISFQPTKQRLKWSLKYPVHKSS